MLPVLVVLFILVPIVELFVILRIGDWLGLWPTLALLVADSILGSILMRTQGRAAWQRFNEALARRRPPAREVLDGVLIIFGGALLLTPGFVTDIVGLLFLLPPTRAVARGLLVRRFAGRMLASAAAGRPGRAGRGGRDFDVEGHATEADPRRLP